MRRELHYVAIVLTFASLTLLVTYPVITQLGTSLAQNPRWSYDAFQQTYELWWFKQALLDIHTSPGNLRWIYFPTGAYYPLLLTYSTVYAVGVPFLLLLSPTVTYNVLGARPRSEAIALKLGGANPVRMRFPAERYWAHECPYARGFKSDPRCGYSGVETSCDGTISDCEARSNAVRYGAFLGLDPDASKLVVPMHWRGG